MCIIITSFIDLAYEDDVDVCVCASTKHVASVDCNFVRVRYCCS